MQKNKMGHCTMKTMMQQQQQQQPQGKHHNCDYIPLLDDNSQPTPSMPSSSSSLEQERRVTIDYFACSLQICKMLRNAKDDTSHDLGFLVWVLHSRRQSLRHCSYDSVILSMGAGRDLPKQQQQQQQQQQLSPHPQLHVVAFSPFWGLLSLGLAFPQPCCW
jgi:hypothetical protein